MAVKKHREAPESASLPAFTAGEVWAAHYARPGLGGPSAIRTIIEADTQTVTYADRTGVRRQASQVCFASWVRSQPAALVGQGEPPPPPPAPKRRKRPAERRAVVPAAPKGHIGAAEAAAELGVTVNTVYYHMRRGNLLTEEHDGRRRIPRAAWKAFKEEWSEG